MIVEGRETISIALCTYNGAVYLPEQLSSLLSQERLPDEIVVCDDHSTDATFDILRAFAADTPFPVILNVNNDRIGSTQNFERAISQCSGDIIFLADQDDVWLPEKLRCLEDVFRGDPAVGAVFSDAELVDHKLTPLDRRLSEVMRFGRTEQALLQTREAPRVLMRRNVVCGATMAFRERFREFVLPIPECWVHDGWIAFLIAAVSRLVYVSSPLIRYRQHGRNQLGASSRTLSDKVQSNLSADRRDGYRLEAERFRLLLDRLESLPTSHSVVPDVRDKIRHMEARASLSQHRLLRFRTILREMIAHRYGHYSNGWQSAAADILF